MKNIFDITDNIVNNKSKSKLSKLKQKIITTKLTKSKIDDLLNIEIFNGFIAEYQELTSDQFNYLFDKNLIFLLAKNKFLTPEQFLKLFNSTIISRSSTDLLTNIKNKDIIKALILNPFLPIQVKDAIIQFIKSRECNYKDSIINAMKESNDESIKQIAETL